METEPTPTPSTAPLSPIQTEALREVICEGTPPPQSHAMRYVPNWQDHLRRALFRYDTPDMPTIYGGGVPALDGVVTRVSVSVSWLDRLRLLFTGRCEVNVRTATQYAVGCTATNSNFNVLPPRWLERG